MSTVTRFDNIPFDDASTKQSHAIKDAAVALESVIDALPHGREKALALTHLEEAYMWANKAIRAQLIQAP